jgi:outer membrane protein
MKKYLFIIAALGAGISAGAQGNSFSFQYSIASGTGDLGSFNKKTSFRGATLEWRKYVQPQVAVGFEIGWNAWYNSLPSETYTSGNASLTGKQYRYQNEFPMLVSADYFLKPDATLQPFVGLGLGTIFSRRDLDMNIYTFRQEAWHFAVRPEVGFLYKMNPETSVYVGLKYYTGFKSGDLAATQSYLALNLGFVFTK